MMAKKKAAKSKTAASIYPKRLPVKLEPRKVISYDPKTDELILEGKPPLELEELKREEERRVDLRERLRDFKNAFLTTTEPHCPGMAHLFDLPDDNSERADRVSIFCTSLLGIIDGLPEHVPSEVRHAILGIRSLLILDHYLRTEGHLSSNVTRAICNAFDIGILSERRQTQKDFGGIVTRGRKNTESQDKAAQSHKQKATSRCELARVEFLRRMAGETGERKRTATLKNMAKVKEGKEYVYGCERTLERYWETWNTDTSTI